MRDGYIRTATFHSRLNKVNESRAAVDQENQRVVQLRDLYINGLTALDQDINALAPAEPDWDKEFELNPQAAHRKQKEYQRVLPEACGRSGESAGLGAAECARGARPCVGALCSRAIYTVRQ